MEMNGKKVAFHTLGCKLNFSETATIARDFNNKGFHQVDFTEPADVYVINTCSVTHNADKECKLWVRRAKEANPDSLVVIVGCYAQLQPEEIAALEGVDLVLGATEKFKITDYLDSLTQSDKGEVHSCEIDEADFYVGAYSIGDRTRAFLKVQDGCDYKCTYCTIPLARGISRSDTLENVIANAHKIIGEGAKEIVLTGVNIGDYGKGEFGNKRHEHTFLELVQELDKVEGIDRFRISSIEPNLLKNETIAFVAQSERFVPHFHIPLQSGSNKILKKMKRRYLKELYAERISTIKALIPHCAIGVDVICGFPGETEADFKETYDFLVSLDISYLHVFTYSQRPNTEADAMEAQVPYGERKKRSKMLRVLSAKKRRAFYESQLGSTREVLFEENFKDGFITGFTENYVKVKTHWNPELVNTKAKIKLNNIDEDGLVRFDYLDNVPILA
ncbi:MAG: tRNA (N(6)-L-threonylcarbamoyladenosine(37)-C(2))-methylthiotransferase MtaB [Bacteroidetes bacterium]|nr:tRNA (N(6)-L-threonylcarbamoyladenosine(37)-C(2))-methylthiotransferase MtaB [Bacteroidota bacterium]